MYFTHVYCVQMRNRGLAADEEKKLYEVTLDNLLTNVGWHRKRTEPVCLGQASTNFAAPVLRHFQLQCSNFIFHTASDVNQLLDHIAKYFDG